MNLILFSLIRKYIYNFIDDIFIYSKSIEENIEHIKQILNIFKEHKLKLIWKNAIFRKLKWKY